MKIDDFSEFNINLCAMSRKHEGMTTKDLALKVAEETGEFATAVLYHEGLVQHKTLKEGMFEEAADVVNVIFAALTAAYPNMSPREIVTAFSNAYEHKAEKYARLIGQDAEDLRVSRD